MFEQSLTYLPCCIVGSLVLTLERSLGLLIFHLFQRHVHYDLCQLLSILKAGITYLRLLLGVEALMLQLEVVDALVDLVTEEIIEDAVCCCDYDVSVLKLFKVLFGVLWQVLAHVAVALGPQNVSQLFELLNPTLLLENGKLFLAWKDRKLERNVE